MLTVTPLPLSARETKIAPAALTILTTAHATITKQWPKLVTAVARTRLSAQLTAYCDRMEGQEKLLPLSVAEKKIAPAARTLLSAVHGVIGKQFKTLTTPAARNAFFGSLGEYAGRLEGSIGVAPALAPASANAAAGAHAIARTSARVSTKTAPSAKTAPAGRRTLAMGSGS